MDGLGAGEFALVALVFRVAIGITFASHGWAKRFSGGGLSGTAGWFDSIGMKPGTFHATTASTMEMATGVALALGFLTPFAGAGIVAIMIVAGWTVHRTNGFAIVGDGWEYTFVVAITAVAIAGFGPGDYSIDHAIGIADGLNGTTGWLIAGGLGIVAGIGHLTTFYRPNPPQPAEADI